MSDETRDADAAAAVFSGLFKIEGGKKGNKEGSKLIKIFLDNFLRKYRGYKSSIQSIIKFRKDSGEDITETICEWFNDATNNFGISINLLVYRATQEKSQDHAKDYANLQEHAKFIGAWTGAFLALIDFGLTNPKFNIQINLGGDTASRFILSSANTVAKAMKKNDKIKRKYLKARIDRIARKHAKELTDRQKTLFASLAALFV